MQSSFLKKHYIFLIFVGIWFYLIHNSVPDKVSILLTYRKTSLYRDGAARLINDGNFF